MTDPLPIDPATPIADALAYPGDPADAPEPDGADVHPDLIGQPVAVDYDTGEVVAEDGSRWQITDPVTLPTLRGTLEDGRPVTLTGTILPAEDDAAWLDEAARQNAEPMPPAVGE
jgi:hypothetical protein